jgi:hypothetical protein
MHDASKSSVALNRELDDGEEPWLSVLRRLAGLDQLETHCAFFAPRGQRSPAELWSVVRHDRFWQTSFARDPVQHTTHS